MAHYQVPRRTRDAFDLSLRMVRGPEEERTTAGPRDYRTTRNQLQKWLARDGRRVVRGYICVSRRCICLPDAFERAGKKLHSVCCS